MPNNSLAIVIAGALIAAALLAYLMVDRFQLVGGAAADGTPAVYRLNQRTGAVTLCMTQRAKQPTSADPVDQYFVQCRD